MRLFWFLKKAYVNSNFTLLKKIIFFFYHIIEFGNNAHIGITTKFESIPFTPHGIKGVFITGSASIGKDCTIFQQVTIGSNKMTGSKTYGAPRIGNNVFIGAGAKIIGSVSIGDNVVIGANCVVVEDVPDDSLVVSEKPKIIVRKKR